MLRLAVALVLSLVAGAAGAEDLARVRVNTFPNAKALPFQAGLAKGIFARHGIHLYLAFPENSKAQRDEAGGRRFDVRSRLSQCRRHDRGGAPGRHHRRWRRWRHERVLRPGRYRVVQRPARPHPGGGRTRHRPCAAGQEDSAAARAARGADYAVKPVGAGAFRFKAMQESRDNAAAILNLPFTVQAEAIGLRSLGRTVDLLGLSGRRRLVMRTGRRMATDAVYRRLCRGAALECDPANRAEAVGLLMEKFSLPQAVAARTYDLLVDPGFGFNVDARFDPEGFRNLLALRAEVQRRGEAAVAPETYVDLSHYGRAIERLDGPRR